MQRLQAVDVGIVTGEDTAAQRRQVAAVLLCVYIYTCAFLFNL